MSRNIQKIKDSAREAMSNTISAVTGISSVSTNVAVYSLWASINDNDLLRAVENVDHHPVPY